MLGTGDTLNVPAPPPSISSISTRYSSTSSISGMRSSEPPASKFKAPTLRLDLGELLLMNLQACNSNYYTEPVYALLGATINNNPDWDASVLERVQRLADSLSHSKAVFVEPSSPFSFSMSSERSVVHVFKGAQLDIMSLWKTQPRGSPIDTFLLHEHMTDNARNIDEAQRNGKLELPNFTFFDTLTGERFEPLIGQVGVSVLFLFENYTCILKWPCVCSALFMEF